MEKICVSTYWLAENIGNSQLILLDASMSKVVGKEPLHYDQLTVIPNSQKCCLETTFCDTASDTVHAFPTRAQFEEGIRKLGISKDSTVVIYDNQGIYSSPRAWWIFRAMGFSQVYILDGGLPKWISENRPIVRQYLDSSWVSDEEISSASNLPSDLVCDSQYVLGAMLDPAVSILDARSRLRYLGEVPEPREGVRSGHIPGSQCFPFESVLDGFCFRPVEDLKQGFSEIVDDPSRQLVFLCGSGVTACIVLAAARMAGFSHTILYDGSWAEWGSDQTLPLE